MKNKFFVIALLFSISFAYAFDKVIFVNLTDPKDFRILYQEQINMRYDGMQKSMRRIYVENMTRLNELNKTISEMYKTIISENETIQSLKSKLEELKNEESERNSEISKIENEIELLKGNLSDIEQLKIKLEEEIKNNILLTPFQLAAIIILFGVISFYIIISEILKHFSKKSENK
jgi:peptidoglycan hydrolase CwlO-like protein